MSRPSRRQRQLRELQIRGRRRDQVASKTHRRRQWKTIGVSALIVAALGGFTFFMFFLGTTNAR